MTPWLHQIELAEQGYQLLKEHMIVYFAMEERTGKTVTCLLTAEHTSAAVKNVLIITKKKALDGWVGTLAKLSGLKKTYQVASYHSAGKVTIKPDLVILDESHSYISGVPKPSAMWKTIAGLTKNCPIIYSSATPAAQGPHLLYHQFALSSWSPWKKYPSFYAWFKSFGIPKSIYVGQREVRQYSNTVDYTFETVAHLFITKTRAELSFAHEPADKLHYVQLSDETKLQYNTLLKKKVIVLEEAPLTPLICDTGGKLRAALHMLEGGVAKVDSSYCVLGNVEKVDYIKQHFGDVPTLVIMYNYIAEGEKLREAFKSAVILQASSFAEGVDLSMYEDLVIYSQNWSTAQHSQRRARQANKLRATPITVHFLLVAKAISEQCYTAVALNKVNFVDSIYEEKFL